MLDGLRGVAALAVALRHLGELFHLPHLARHGYLAVDFFFLLSGFVIVSAYEGRLSTAMDIPSFLRIRAVRLYPLIGLATGIGAFVAFGQHMPAARVTELALFSALALPFPSRAGLFPLNGPLWSMFYEVASNLAYAVVRPLLSPRRLGVSLAVAAVMVIVVAARVGNLDAGFDLRHGWAGVPRLAWPFLAGVALARLQAAGRLSRSAPPAWSTPAWSTPAWSTPAWSTAAWSTAAWLLGAVMSAIFFLPQGAGPGWAALDAGLSLVVLPTLLVLGLRATADARTVSVCAIAGELSYPLYAVHKPIEVAIAGLASGQSAATRAGLAAACLATVLACAFAASRAYDIPIRRFLSARLLHGRMSAAPSEALETSAISS